MDDLAAECEATEPEYAEEVRRLKAWRRDLRDSTRNIKRRYSGIGGGGMPSIATAFYIVAA
jgi:hypothetical protein